MVLSLNILTALFIMCFIMFYNDPIIYLFLFPCHDILRFVLLAGGELDSPWGDAAVAVPRVEYGARRGGRGGVSIGSARGGGGVRGVPKQRALHLPHRHTPHHHCPQASHRVQGPVSVWWRAAFGFPLMCFACIHLLLHTHTHTPALSISSKSIKCILRFYHSFIVQSPSLFNISVIYTIFFFFIVQPSYSFNSSVTSHLRYSVSFIWVVPNHSEQRWHRPLPHFSLHIHPRIQSQVIYTAQFLLFGCLRINCNEQWWN